MLTTAEPAGTQCPSGGVKVQSGLDTDNSGTLQPGEVTSTSFVCSGAATVRSWRTAQLIETEDTANALSPQIAIDNNGNALAVWDQSVPGARLIYANRYTAVTNRWGVPVVLSSSPTATDTDPAIAMDADGNAVAVWVGSNGGQIVASTYTAIGNSWALPLAIANPGPNIKSRPKVAVDGNGRGIAVWEERSTTLVTSVLSARYRAGSWSGLSSVETSNDNAFSPQIAVNANGVAQVTWQQLSNGQQSVWANRINTNTTTGTWGTAVLLETDDVGPATNPQIGVDGDGNAVAVWEQSDGTRFNIYSNRYTAATSSWGTAVLLETDAGSAGAPQIAVDDAGNAVVVWQQVESARNNIVANRYAVATGTWGTATLIETDNSGAAIRPQVAVDVNGNAVSVWQIRQGTQDSIYANRFNVAANSWGTPELIETFTTGTAGNAQVAVNASGNAVAVWEQSNGSRRDIAANTLR